MNMKTFFDIIQTGFHSVHQIPEIKQTENEG